MRVTIYLKDGAIDVLENVQNIDYINWYPEEEIWFYKESKTGLELDRISYKEKDIEQIKVRMG